MPKPDEQALSSLVQDAVDDVRDLAKAEVALAKAELQSLGTSLIVTLSTITAACVLCGIALATTAAMIVLAFGGRASSALGAASAVIVLIAAAAVTFCVRMLPDARASRLAQRRAAAERPAA